MPLYTKDPEAPVTDLIETQAQYEARLAKASATPRQSAGRVPGVVGRKIVYIDQDTIFNLFMRNWDGVDSVIIPHLDLPDTAKVESVFLCERRRSFGFVIADPSFEDVGPCVELPRVDVNWRWVELKKDK